METIIVTTDFSASSANALNYACAFALANGYKIVLAHVYTIPVTYTGEALSLAAVNEALDADRDNLKEELQRARAAYAGVDIEADMIVGAYLESLQSLVKEVNPGMIIMGAVGEYSELWLWDDDWLNALITVSCPVLVVPAGVVYKPFKNIAFACDYKKSCLPHQADIVKRIAKASGATLHIIHVTPEASGLAANKHASHLQETFADMQPHYHLIEDKRIIRSISDFTVQHNIDLLLVMPHKHGLWHSLFNKSYTKQLARLNHLPVMAIHE